MKSIILVLLLTVGGCRPCEYILHDMGLLPEEALAYVPYQKGESVILQHSEGGIITFSVDRYSTIREESMGSHSCAMYKYEENITTLRPDHPVMEISFYINNMDTTIYFGNVYIERAGFTIPTQEFQYEYFDYADSLLIDSTYYYNVFKLSNESANYNLSRIDNPISIDSLYYNYENGILKVTLTNDEYYEISN